jgi:transposase InsO family protein
MGLNLSARCWTNGLTADSCSYDSLSRENRNRIAYIESFNGEFRDECLNEHWFLSMRHARQVIAAWRKEYDQERPHSSLGYLTPSRFADRFLTADSMLVSD